MTDFPLSAGERKTLEKIKRLRAEGRTVEANRLIRSWLNQARYPTWHGDAYRRRRNSLAEVFIETGRPW